MQTDSYYGTALMREPAIIGRRASPSLPSATYSSRSLPTSTAWQGWMLGCRHLLRLPQQSRGYSPFWKTHGDQTNNQVHTTVRRRGRRAFPSRSLPMLAAQQCWMPESDGYHSEEARQAGVLLAVLANLAAQQCWMPESDGYHSEEARQAGVLLPVLGHALLQLLPQLAQPGVHGREGPERAGAAEGLAAADGLGLLPRLHLQRIARRG